MWLLAGRGDVPVSEATQEVPASALPKHDAADDFASTVRGQVQSYVVNRKVDLARSVSDVAGAIRVSSSGFAEQPHVKAFFDSAAEGIEELSEEISRRTFAELYDEIDAAARRRPGVTFAAAALAGFALFRFLKASRMRPVPRSRAVLPIEVFPTPDL
ncbi:hypothetical protein ASF56_24110 [Methylobacterium sp. Leaf122]|uniref:Uncharacterized protein n=1 Tax=Methylorubrum extorquens TaxID=408 RepID=A0AAX3WG69_METEX|nr:hypothetical protein ASF33_06215 [Methylobacterium sp. Leaf92]KQQ01165.1 hypothetical protein ASF59_03000 [Methylobacterium sp. Leaf121]KQQ15178.1 hypothetical protein ASF56_24110 [Methylobacterium sp. Leaf122]WHQ70538.1 hypothetical protein KEC54_02605 [Methylorubrum extorquens]